MPGPLDPVETDQDLTNLPPIAVHCSSEANEKPWPLQAFMPLQALAPPLQALWPLQALPTMHLPRGIGGRRPGRDNGAGEKQGGGGGCERST